MKAETQGDGSLNNDIARCYLFHVLNAVKMGAFAR